MEAQFQLIFYIVRIILFFQFLITSEWDQKMSPLFNIRKQKCVTFETDVAYGSSYFWLTWRKRLFFKKMFFLLWFHMFWNQGYLILFGSPFNLKICKIDSLILYNIPIFFVSQIQNFYEEMQHHCIPENCFRQQKSEKGLTRKS